VTRHANVLASRRSGTIYEGHGEEACSEVEWRGKGWRCCRYGSRLKLREKWERLSERLRLPAVRGWMYEHLTLVVSIAAVPLLVLLVLAIAKIFNHEPPPKPVVIENDWYYDLNTGKLFIAEAGLEPPIQAPSGPTPDGKPAGVRGLCPELQVRSERIRSIHRLPGDDRLARHAAQVAGQPGGRHRHSEMDQGQNDPQSWRQFWVPADSPLGLRILRQAYAPNKKGQYRPTVD